MKHTQMTKRVLACGLALAMATSTVGVYPSLTVSAAKKTKKNNKNNKKKTSSKMKLSKKKVSVTEGKTVAVSVKKATKKVSWSVKNKKVVSITKTSGKKKNKATLKGLKKGSTTVIAKIGKKKLTCKVTVKACAIKSFAMDPLDSSVMVLNLAKSTPVNATDVKISVKEYGNGSYNTSPKVETLTTTDQKTYRLYLTNDIANGAYVKVAIGKVSKEAMVANSFVAADDKETVELFEKDATITGYNLNKLFTNGVGNISYSLKKGSKLPAGLVLAGKKGIIKGIPSAAGTTTVTIVAKDEAGRTAETNLTLKVYDETTLAVKDQEAEIMSDDYMVDYTALIQPKVSTTGAMSADNTYVEKITITPKGGSGMYKYALQSADPTVKLSTDDYDATKNATTQRSADSVIVYIPYGLSEGLHTYTISITDAADPAKTAQATVNFTVTTCYNVSGSVKDVAGNILQGGEKIYFIPAKSNKFSDKIDRRTYKKYKKTVKEYGYSSYTSKELVAGNERDPYKANGNYTYENEYSTSEVVDDVTYYTYEKDYSAVVGPLPKPAILDEAPTNAPAVSPSAEPTVAPGSTAAPSAFKVPDLAAGNYEAELPAGDYIVKVEGLDGIKYQLDGQVSVTTDAVDTTALTLPVRFTNATATLKYSNGQVAKNKDVYFETDNKQYENWKFGTTTDYQGQLNVSLPSGSYKVYIFDEEGKRVYLANSLVVDSNTTNNLGDLVLPIARYAVSGVLSDTSVQGTTTILSDTKVYFYNAKGKCVTSVYTAEERVRDANGVLNDNPAKGTYSVQLPDGVYAVRCNVGESYKTEYGSTYTRNRYVTIGTVTVAGADLANQNFSYAGFTEYVKSASALNIGTEATFASTGNNEIIGKFTVTEPGSYDVTSALNMDTDLDVEIYKADGTSVSDGSTYDSETQKRVTQTTNLQAGDFYEIATPPYYDGSAQALGVVSLKVEKHVEDYAKYAVDFLANGTATPVTCTRNTTNKKLKGVTYLKMAATPGTTYEVSYGTPTIGVDDINFSVVEGASSAYSYGDKKGTFTFTASAEVVYLQVSVGGDYLTATVNTSIAPATSNNVAPTNSPAPTPSVTPGVTPDATPTATPDTE